MWPVFLLALAGCHPPPAETAAHDAKCAGIRAMFAEGQRALIEKGLCDDAGSVHACVPHVALRESFVATLKAEECPTLREDL